MTIEEWYTLGLLVISFLILLSIISAIRENRKEKKLAKVHRDLQEKIKKEKEGD